jgi:hypothetical protein
MAEVTYNLLIDGDQLVIDGDDLVITDENDPPEPTVEGSVRFIFRKVSAA